MSRQQGLLCLFVLSLAATSSAGQERGTKQVFVYKKIGDVNLEMVVNFPADWQAKDKRPAIVFFYGGGWNGGNMLQFEPQARYLAQRGMVAARADYRVKSRHGVTPDKCVEDAKSAVRWLRQNAPKLGIDPDRIVAAGGSAGGHIAACTALAEGVEPQGEDLKVSSRPSALLLFNPVLRVDGPELLGRLGNDEILARKISPTLHLNKNAPPTLLLFGTTDKLIVQATEFMKRSKELGNRTELFTAEGQAHGFFNKAPWQQRTLYRADEFLASLGYLAGKPTFKAP